MGRLTTILIEKGYHSSVLDVRSFRAAECDTDHYMVVANVRERLAISKQAAQRFDGERFNPRKLNGLEVRTNRSAALVNLSDSEDVNRAREKIKENIKISAKDNLGL